MRDKINELNERLKKDTGHKPIETREIPRRRIKLKLKRVNADKNTPGKKGNSYDSEKTSRKYAKKQNDKSKTYLDNSSDSDLEILPPKSTKNKHLIRIINETKNRNVI